MKRERERDVENGKGKKKMRLGIKLCKRMVCENKIPDEIWIEDGDGFFTGFPRKAKDKINTLYPNSVRLLILQADCFIASAFSCHIVRPYTGSSQLITNFPIHSPDPPFVLV